MCLTYLLEILVKQVSQYYENTQSPMMHALIPLAKRFTCMKTSLPLNLEASLGVYS